MMAFFQNCINDSACRKGRDTSMSESCQENGLIPPELETWMNNLPDRMKFAPLSGLAIPGSHNAFSYSLDPDTDVSPEVPDSVKQLSKYFGKITKAQVHKWSITQTLTCTEQLMAGIRYLNIRVAYKGSENDFFFIHGLYGAKIKSLLEEVKAFLLSHPSEVVFLDFEHFFFMNEHKHEELQQSLLALFKGMICPRGKVEALNLHLMRNQGYQVIIIYRNQTAANSPLLWFTTSFPNPWANSISPDFVVDFLNKKISQRVTNTFHIAQAILTPSVGFIFKHPSSSLESTCAGIATNAFSKWISSQRPDVMGMNIVMYDFVSYNNHQMTKLILESNRKVNASESTIVDSEYEFAMPTVTPMLSFVDVPSTMPVINGHDDAHPSIENKISVEPLCDVKM